MIAVETLAALVMAFFAIVLLIFLAFGKWL
jgi:hypothetical protein